MPSFVSARWRSSVRTSSSRAATACDQLRLGFGDRAARRLELRVDVGVLDLGDHLALADARAFLELQPREPAAGLHADVAAVARDDVAGGDEHRQIGRAAGACTTCVARATSTSGARRSAT